MSLTYEGWSQNAIQSAAMLSRTARGVYDTSWSKDKSPLQLGNGDELARRVAENLDTAAKFAWGFRLRVFSAEETRGFLDSLAVVINTGLLKEGQSLYRTWDIRYPGPIPAADVEASYASLCTRLTHELVHARDLVPVAARLEKEITLLAHPFADGCGRVARIAGAWVLSRQSMLPALFSNREQYYGAMRSAHQKWTLAYRRAIPR